MSYLMFNLGRNTSDSCVFGAEMKKVCHIFYVICCKWDQYCNIGLKFIYSGHKKSQVWLAELLKSRFFVVWHHCSGYFSPVCLLHSARWDLFEFCCSRKKCWQLSKWICLPLRRECVVTGWKMSVCACSIPQYNSLSVCIKLK